MNVMPAVNPGQQRVELGAPTPAPAPSSPDHGETPPAPGAPKAAGHAFFSSEQQFDEAREALGNIHNSNSLKTALIEVRQAALKGPSRNVAALLEHKTLSVHSLSTFGRENRLEPLSQVPVAWFLRESGLNVAQNLEQLDDLVYVTSNPLPPQSERGNYWGLLATPVALSAEQRTRLREVATQALADVAPGTGLFALFDAKHADSTPPASAAERLEQMIDSPQVQALGKQLEAAFDGASTPTSACEWAMAAMVLELDPQAGNKRGQVAGYDLLAPANWGLTPAQVVARLSEHLVAQGNVVAAMAPAAARLLLAGAAPVFLVPDMPANLVVGSPAWMRLSTVVETTEQWVPGSTARIAFGELMTRASHAPVTHAQAIVEQKAQEQALIDWGLAHDRLPANRDRLYTPAQLNAVRSAFNSELASLQKAQRQLSAPMPDRRAIALAELKKAYGEDLPFEARTLSIANIDGSESEWHSLLDIYMAGKMDRIPHGDRYDFSLGARVFRVKPLPDIQAIFDAQFDAYFKGLKDGLMTVVEHQLSQLPLKDRRAIASGRVAFFSLRKASQAQAEEREPEAEAQAAVARYGLWMRVLTRKEKYGTGEAYADFKHDSYEIFPLQGLVRTREDLPRTPSNPAPRAADPQGFAARQAQGVGAWLDYDAYRSGTAPKPGKYSSGLLIEKASSKVLPENRIANADGTPNADHPRFCQVARVVAEHLLHDREGMKAMASGKNAVEDEEASIKAGHAFVTSLIPFKTAIENAAMGDVSAAARDFALDLLGFVIPGSKAVGQAAKAAGRLTQRLGTRAFKVSDILLRAAASGLNPVDGLGSLGMLAANGVKTTLKAGHRELTLLQGLHFNPAAYAKSLGVVEGQVGLAGAATQPLRVIAKRHSGRWHAFDVKTGKVYGPALKDFRPVSPAPGAADGVSNVLFDQYAVSNAKVAGLVADRNGVYRAANNVQYIRNVDASGKAAVYQVREVSQAGSQGHVQARLINPRTHRQTEFLLGGSGKDQWQRLGLRGAGDPPGEGYRSIELPMDEVERVVRRDGQLAFHANFTTEVRFDAELGAWRKIGRGEELGDVFWRTGPYEWRAGSVQEYLKVKATLPKAEVVETVRVAALPVPSDATAIRQQINYVWAGGAMPEDRIATILANAEKTPGYKSIVHVDADTAPIFEQIKARLHEKSSNLEVRNLNDDSFFQGFKASNAGEAYRFFRQGAGQNYAAASDVLRYPLINTRGGIYLDSDDVITAAVGQVELKASTNQVLLNSHVSHADTDFTGYNTSVFASHPGNPVLREVSEDLYRRFKDSQPWLENNRPYLSDNPTAEQISTFNAYQKKIFEVTGPTLFNDVLKKNMGDAYDLSWAATDPALAGIKLSSADASAFADAYNHYLPFNRKFAVTIGSQTTMARMP